MQLRQPKSGWSNPNVFTVCTEDNKLGAPFVIDRIIVSLTTFRLPLCCKTGQEFEQYYKAVEAGQRYRYIQGLRQSSLGALPNWTYNHFHITIPITSVSHLLPLLRWYCHFDDDEYVNVPVLMRTLRVHKDKVYLGHWPSEMPRRQKKVMVSYCTV